MSIYVQYIYILRQIPLQIAQHVIDTEQLQTKKKGKTFFFPPNSKAIFVALNFKVAKQPTDSPETGDPSAAPILLRRGPAMVPIGEACIAILGSGVSSRRQVVDPSSTMFFFRPEKTTMSDQWKIWCFRAQWFGIHTSGYPKPFTRGSQESKPPGPQTTN